MTVTTKCTLTVSLRELRQAVTAVVPHAEPTKSGDEISKLSRIRLTAGTGELLVIATCSTTAALAAVTIDEDSRAVVGGILDPDDGPFSVDLPPGPLRQMLATFKVGRPTADAEDAYAELTFDEPRQHVTLTDVDALLPGLSMTVPVLDLSDSFPAVPEIMQRGMASASGSPKVKPLIVDASPVGLFRHAAKAYGRPLTWEPTGTADSPGWVVWCGPQFIGLFSSVDPSGETLGRRNSERNEHLKRLGLEGGGVLKSVG